jgi:hypothetical protein
MASKRRYSKRNTPCAEGVTRCVAIGATALLFCFAASCQRTRISSETIEESGPSAPDLRQCTRIETRFVRPITDVFPSIEGRQSVLSSDEFAYVKGFQVFLVDEQQRIKAIGNQIAKARHIITRRSDAVYAVPALRDVAHVVCYRGTTELTSFMLKERSAFCTPDQEWFDYGDTGLDLFDFTPQVQVFAVRSACAYNIRKLWDSARFVDPNRWCDAVQRRFSEVNLVYLSHAMHYFRCPAAGEGKCHYAINPDCKRDSPRNTVLLFETKAGWNQHGGPELFTFDNHDPKGGLVLLNDGTVKFVRTEEELKQLRWK